MFALDNTIYTDCHERPYIILHLFSGHFTIRKQDLKKAVVSLIASLSLGMCLTACGGSGGGDQSQSGTGNGSASSVAAEDGLKYDFVLKSGIVFSNVSALTASDVKYSFERLLIAAAQNTDIPLEVVGADKLMKKEADSLRGFEVTDDTHFTITLKAPNAGFLAELSAPAMSIVDAETMAQVKNFGREPADTIGTGPYIITEWEANDHYTLVYNDKYCGEEPSVKKLIVRVVPNPSTQNLMFQNGKLDMIDLLSLPPDAAFIRCVPMRQMNAAGVSPL